MDQPGVFGEDPEYDTYNVRRSRRLSGNNGEPVIKVNYVPDGSPLVVKTKKRSKKHRSRIKHDIKQEPTNFKTEKEEAGLADDLDTKDFIIKQEEFFELVKQNLLVKSDSDYKDEYYAGKEEETGEFAEQNDADGESSHHEVYINHELTEVPIVFDPEKAFALDQEYDLYSNSKWINLDQLRDYLMGTDWSELKGKHPNFQFIYESHETRSKIVKCLILASKEQKDRWVLDRKSWENIDFLPGGPLFCSKETILMPRKRRTMKDQTVTHLVTAVRAIIPLIYWNEYVTKRNIWYQYFQALKLSQESSDELFEDIACGVGVPRASIHILAASKGLVHGNVTLYLHKGKRDIPEGTSTSRILSDWSSADKAISDIQVIDCSSGSMIPNKVCKIVDIKSDAKFLLVVEKEATFQTLTETGNFAQNWNCIIITGKGYPDVNTRHLVRLIWSFLQIPVLALVDGDPFGFDIYCQYKYGSISLAYDSLNLTIPQMRLIGIRPSDFEIVPFNEYSFRILTRNDQNKIREIQQRPYADYDPDLRIELHNFQKYRRKVELQALNVIAMDYLYNEFLPKRIVTGRFLHHDLLLQK